MKLKDKVAIITGAASGIGRATAELFAKEGAKIVVADINPEAGQEVARKIKSEGGEATFVQVNVSQAADLKRMVETAVNSYGKLDILFNNAGVAGDSLENTTEEKWRRVIDINLTGPFLGCLYAIPEMRKGGGGNILMTASTGGLKASGQSPAYTVSKAGVIMLARALARNLGKDNIRVNSISPALTDTGLTDTFLGNPKTEEERRTRLTAMLSKRPLGKIIKPEEVASAALFLMSDEASSVDGTNLLVDGGHFA